jgi:hypothetical protein
MHNEQLIKHKFHQCAPANLETSCLLEIGNISQILQLRYCYQFPGCVLALTVVPALVKEDDRGGQGHTSESLLHQCAT